MMTSLKHQFLLAMPSLRESWFSDTITYICDHGETGALGLMVNRPTDLRLRDMCRQLDLDPVGCPDVPVFQGGPVDPQYGFVLHTADERFAGLAIGEGLMLSTGRDVLAAIADGSGPRQFLVALGYAGWSAGQLEAELGENAWLTTPGSQEILFDVPPAERIDAAARILGIDFRLIAAHAGHA